jgi:hypothetical protein
MPIAVNTDPNCPGSDIHKGDNLNSWDTVHQDRGKHSMSSIPKARWDEIFGPECPHCSGDDNGMGCTCKGRSK